MDQHELRMATFVHAVAPPDAERRLVHSWNEAKLDFPDLELLRRERLWVSCYSSY